MRVPLAPPSLIEHDTFPGQRHVQVEVGGDVVAELCWRSDRFDARAVEHALALLEGLV